MTTTPVRVPPRFLAPDLDRAAAEVHLPAEESRHLTRVLRLGCGAVVSVFDGRGYECLARVTSAGDGRVTVAVLAPLQPARESPVPFTLVQAVLKGGAMDAIVRDATMLGAAAIQPVLTLHTAVKPAAALRAESVARWRRIAVASAKQSRRATVPEVRAPALFGPALDGTPAELVLLFVEPSAGHPTQSMRTLIGSAAPEAAVLVVGPEGGWAAEEIERARSTGAVLVTLGMLTLRAEAVPMAAMATFRMLWE